MFQLLPVTSIRILLLCSFHHKFLSNYLSHSFGPYWKFWCMTFTSQRHIKEYFNVCAWSLTWYSHLHPKRIWWQNESHGDPMVGAMDSHRRIVTNLISHFLCFEFWILKAICVGKHLDERIVRHEICRRKKGRTSYHNNVAITSSTSLSQHD